MVDAGFLLFELCWMILFPAFVTLYIFGAEKLIPSIYYYYVFYRYPAFKYSIICAMFFGSPEVPRPAELDEKIGSILIYVLDSDSQTDEAKYTIRPKGSADKERCYVYRSELFDHKPYYLTREGTRVLVMDEKKVDYFRDGVEPEALRGKIKDYHRVAEEEVQVVKKTINGKPPKKVGTIKIQVPQKEDSKIVFVTEKRDVYVAEDEPDVEPYYYYMTGSKKTVVDQRRIRFSA